MSVYGLDGTQLNAIYEADGDEMAAAYNAIGTLVYGTAPGTMLKVMEYNVGGWYDGTGTNVPEAKINEYYELQFNTIKDANPDVLFINEYMEQFSDTGYSALSFLQQFFPYIKAVPSGTYYGRAFCAKYPLSDYQSHIYTGFSPRYYDTISMNVGGKTITLCVTHLDPSSSENRHTQTEELITFLQTLQTPFICAGDLNTTKSASTSSDDYVGVIKPLLDAGFKLANMGDFGRFITYSDESTNWQGALDNIVFSSNFTIKSVTVDTRKLNDGLTERTDHMPLIAVAEVPNT